MRRLALILVTLILCGTVYGRPYRFLAGVELGKATLTSGDSAKFPLQNSHGFSMGYNLGESWRLTLALSRYRLANDTGATSSFTFDHSDARATRKWKATRVGLAINRRLLSIADRLHFWLGAGGGLMVWKVVEAGTDSVLDVQGMHNETTDFAASEVFLSSGGSLEVSLARRWSLGFAVHADYLTGGGAEFKGAVASARDRWLFDGGLFLTFAFAGGPKEVAWPSNRPWSTPNERTRAAAVESDSDNDGVPDSADLCLATPQGVVVDVHGCPVDSDSDGVPDGPDDCPGTDSEARNKVDIHGCPVDSDFDGVPDYLDRCPLGPVGAWVDSSGCPVDSDGDGVPDGLDDCPNTLHGVAVDQHGCIDLTMLSQPMVLNIDYEPGSFEIDFKTQDRLRDLARILNFVPAIKLDVNGYTDDIGTAPANQKLSEKRARRVLDFLVALGVAADRMKAFGRGEANFVASNQTAEGRARNRRIEIIFYR